MLDPHHGCHSDWLRKGLHIKSRAAIHYVCGVDVLLSDKLSSNFRSRMSLDMSEITINANCHIQYTLHSLQIHFCDHFRQWSQIHLISCNPSFRFTLRSLFLFFTATLLTGIKTNSWKTTKTVTLSTKNLASDLDIKMIYISYKHPERFHIPGGIASMAYCHECVIRSNTPSCYSPSHITFVNRSLIYVPCSHAKR